MKQAFDKRFLATNALLSLTAAVFFAIQMLRVGRTTDAYTIYEFGGLLGYAIKMDPSQLWRLISPIFVHIGWEHFLFNSLTLYVLGYQVEELFGWKKFLAIYLLSGVMGNAFVLYFTPAVVTAGASTSLFGLFDLMALLRYHAKSPHIKALGERYVGLLVVNLAISFLTPSISLTGHLGGLVGGLLCAVMITPPHEGQLFAKWQSYLACALYFVLIGFFILTIIA
ncbi:rhomboid family intramembrane serine protease [Streptococcus sp. X16XC17]|uniref:rhomboid family intramembrane serine protease n=1 Tax=unclassified Streptococcus TaxID=2608887 RepID=UPI00066FC9D6|nr:MULTISPECIES: rhomboid family intramembrane serine protease [unclassified Streptococcus]TCD45831.1 rhomboid family intramembrane serine protease [Streptococcus sp. X16XC17]